ncbi:MAG TPA: DUF6174 domain-containing protein [Gemmataceae bacterium]|nr:DUF6174 domain-containing protein [Gemmataceae bacterium]
MQNKSRPRSRGWIWFFVLLVGLGTAAVTLPLLYNLSIQLRPEELAAARERWKAKGPRDYDLQFQEKITQNGQETESNWFVQVRDGKVISATRNEQKQPIEECANLTVEGQFAEIERGLQIDQAAGARRNYATAAFDLRDGHPTHYVRRVRGSGDRLEWNVNLFKPGEGRTP